jgi:hypothetical protein
MGEGRERCWKFITIAMVSLLTIPLLLAVGSVHAGVVPSPSQLAFGSQGRSMFQHFG